MLRVRLFERRNQNFVQVHLNGDLVTTTHLNVLDNVFFSNDPDHTCEPLPAKPRNRGGN